MEPTAEPWLPAVPDEPRRGLFVEPVRCGNCGHKEDDHEEMVSVRGRHYPGTCDVDGCCCAEYEDPEDA